MFLTRSELIELTGGKRPSSITRWLDDQRTLEVKTTLAGDHIDYYFDAFDAFLLAAGFAQESINERSAG